MALAGRLGTGAARPPRPAGLLGPFSEEGTAMGVRLIDYCLFYLFYHWEWLTFMAQAILLMMPESFHA